MRVEVLSIEVLVLVEVVALRHKCCRLLKLWFEVEVAGCAQSDKRWLSVKRMGAGERVEGSEGRERLVDSPKVAVKQKKQ